MTLGITKFGAVLFIVTLSISDSQHGHCHNGLICDNQHHYTLGSGA